MNASLVKGQFHQYTLGAQGLRFLTNEEEPSSFSNMSY
jgi:hypothetical protein